MVMVPRWWLRGGAAQVAVAQPVAVAPEADDLGVVHQSVDHGRGDHVVAEDLASAPERLVGGDDQAGALVAGGDELEEQVGRLWLEGDVADLVDYQQRGAAKASQIGLQPAGGVGVGQADDPLDGGGEQHPVAGLACPDPQADRQMRLAGAWWTQEDHVLAGGD